MGSMSVHVHRTLEPGLLESVDEAVLDCELGRRGFHVARQVPMDVDYEGVRIEAGFRADLVVEGKGLVELKTVFASLRLCESDLGHGGVSAAMRARLERIAVDQASPFASLRLCESHRHHNRVSGHRTTSPTGSRRRSATW